VSVEKGYDPREFALIAFGGAGPMQAGELAGFLGTPTIIIPTVPGILCALGLLATDLQYDYVRTCLQRAPDYDLQTIEATYRALLEEADTCLHAEGIARERRRFTLLADLRYAKQGYELTVELPGERIDQTALAQLIEGFHRLHEQLYTFADRDAAVEIVNLRVKALGLVDKLELPRLASADHTEPAATAARQVYFPESGFSEVPVYARSDLLAGHVIMGPAIVDQLDTTTVIFPGQRARVDEFGHFIISR
jgi:N-methylhydantoinase A